MGNRYTDKTIFRNQNEEYDAIFEERDVSFIRHYGTSTMVVPTSKQRANLIRQRHIWTTGDKFYKLALKYYNDPQYWWVIALYNEAPTETHLRVGDVLIIPLPLNEVLRLTKA